MKCACNGKMRVSHTVVQGEKVIRYRFCDKCSKKIKTIELNLAYSQNERFVLSRIRDLIGSLR